MLSCKSTLIDKIKEENLFPSDWEIYVYVANNLKETAHFLFEQEWTILILGEFTQETIRFCKKIRKSEVFTYLPIFGVGSPLQLKDTMGIFSDIYSPEDPITTCALRLSNLIRNSLTLRKAENAIADMKEKSIYRFLLLDHVRQYISKETLRVVGHSSRLQQLTIKEKEEHLTVVFADISNFTSLSEHLPPKSVIHMINKIFSLAIPIIHQESGDIDKFIGDAFLAVFHSAYQAIKALTNIFKIMNQEKLNGKTMFLHAAINTGPVLRGNVGGDGRFDHTLIGDTVNIASRLLSIAKKNEILITEASLKEADISIPKLLRFQTYLLGKNTSTTYYSSFPYLAEKYSFSPTRPNNSTKSSDNLKGSV